MNAEEATALNKAILEALGLNGANIRYVNIHLSPQEAPVVTVEQLLPVVTGEPLATILRPYRLERI